MEGAREKREERERERSWFAVVFLSCSHDDIMVWCKDCVPQGKDLGGGSQCERKGEGDKGHCHCHAEVCKRMLLVALSKAPPRRARRQLGGSADRDQTVQTGSQYRSSVHGLRCLERITSGPPPSLTQKPLLLEPIGTPID